MKSVYDIYKNKQNIMQMFWSFYLQETSIL